MKRKEKWGKQEGKVLGKEAQGRWRRKVNKETKKSRSQMTRKKEGKKDLRGVRF